MDPLQKFTIWKWAKRLKDLIKHEIHVRKVYLRSKLYIKETTLLNLLGDNLVCWLSEKNPASSKWPITCYRLVGNVSLDADNKSVTQHWIAKKQQQKQYHCVRMSLLFFSFFFSFLLWGLLLFCSCFAFVPLMNERFESFKFVITLTTPVLR